jgi:hypothetical protein
MALKTAKRKKEIPVLKKSAKTKRIIPRGTIEAPPLPPAIGQQAERVPKVPAPEHPAKEHVVEVLKLPNLKDFPYNWIELPYAIVRTNGEDLFFSELGETDKGKIIALHSLVKKGYKIKSMQVTPRNTYLFVLER